MRSNQRTLSFHQSEIRSEIMTWWRSLQDDRASCAALCRARDIEAVYLVESFHRLAASLKKHADRLDLDRLAATAMLLARVNSHDSSVPLGRRMGASGTRTRVVSEIRFRGLARARTLRQQIREVASVIDLLRGRANILELAEMVYWWSRESIKSLTVEYFNTALAINK